MNIFMYWFYYYKWKLWSFILSANAASLDTSNWPLDLQQTTFKIAVQTTQQSLSIMWYFLDYKDQISAVVGGIVI